MRKSDELKARLMAIYNIKKPSYSLWALLKSILIKAIVVPILLWLPMILWEVLKKGVNLLAGKAVGRYFLGKNTNASSLEIDELNASEMKMLSLHQHTIVTHDGAALDTLEIEPIAQQPIDAKYKKYIINFIDKKVCYQEMIHELKADALAFKSNLVSFNYRGVGNSTGYPKSFNDLVIDGIAQVQRLLDQNITPLNITLNGHAMGGAIAALVAYHFHQQKQPINVFNDRSFSTNTNVIVGSIRGGNKETWRGKLLGWLAKPFIKLGLSLVQWEIDADDAFKAIPIAYRDYMLVKAPKNLKFESVIDDKAITSYASMHAALKPERSAQKAAIDTLISQCQQIENKGDLAFRSNLNDAQKQLREARGFLKERKMMNSCSADAHYPRSSDLINRKDKTGQTFFSEFLERVQLDHGVIPPVECVF